MQAVYVQDVEQLYKDAIDSYVEYVLNCISARLGDTTPNVEDIQDIVEFVLQSVGQFDAAKHFILYRYKRSVIRTQTYIPQDVVDAFAEDRKYFPTELQLFQFYDKYSKWNHELGRRETWVETTNRVGDFLYELAENTRPNAIKREEIDALTLAIRNHKVMPSMRILSQAGEAARLNNAAIYNCCYVAIDDWNVLPEIMYLAMAGCGVGYSVENKYISQLPVIEEIKSTSEQNIFKYVVEDSTDGWVDAFRCALGVWIGNESSYTDIEFDFSKIRPAGSVLKTKGGRASGPEPLKRLFDYTKKKIRSNAGKRLTSLDWHDIICMIGDCVISGGVRRTALIALFDFDDQLMLTCKDGDFEVENSQRWNANNSAVWPSPENITQSTFIDRMYHTFKSKRGEPGIFNRAIAVKTLPERRDKNHEFGTNPCGEIYLRNKQMCNLTSVVVKPEDTEETLIEKVRLATILGTIQSCATYFPGLSKEWEINCNEERLLGVDISGQLDNWLTTYNNPNLSELFSTLQSVAINTNIEWAKRLGINQSAAITCVKPSGNSSTLLDVAPGIHPRWSEYYIRNVRVAAASPLAKVLADSGYVLSPENGQDPINPTTWVVSFPVRSPEQAITRNDITALDHLEQWVYNKMYWTEHNPSVTINYTPDEMLNIMEQFYELLTTYWLAGVTILPKYDADYAQLPYIEITEAEYNEQIKNIKPIQFERLYLHEKQDMTTAAQELACAAGQCEL